MPLALGSLLAGWLFYHFVMKRLSHDINSLNTTLLLLTLLLHRTVKRFAAAVEQGAGRSWAVIVLYHLYAGVAGLIQFTAVGEKVARLAASICTASTFPLITAAAGALFACFIPSSGGQWTVQGFVTVKTAMAVGVSVQRGILALGWAITSAISSLPSLVCRDRRHRSREFPLLLRVWRGVRRDLVCDRSGGVYVRALLVKPRSQGLNCTRLNCTRLNCTRVVRLGTLEDHERPSKIVRERHRPSARASRFRRNWQSRSSVWPGKSILR